MLLVPVLVVLVLLLPVCVRAINSLILLHSTRLGHDGGRFFMYLHIRFPHPQNHAVVPWGSPFSGFPPPPKNER